MMKLLKMFGFSSAGICTMMLALGLATHNPQKAQAVAPLVIGGVVVVVVVVGSGWYYFFGGPAPIVCKPSSACATMPGTILCGPGAMCTSATTTPCGCLNVLVGGDIFGITSTLTCTCS